MLEYNNSANIVNIELVLLTGGEALTGKSPYVEIRDKRTGLYFDHNSRTFTAVAVSSTAPLLSAIDGLYTTQWSIANLFNSPEYLTFEYHDSTAFCTDDVFISTEPSNVGGGSPVTLQGVWTAKQKRQLFDDIKKIKEEIKKLRIDVSSSIRKILNKESLTKEDIKSVTELKERDFKMYQELLKILNLKNTANESEVFEKLEKYIQKEEEAKTLLLEKLDSLLNSKIEEVYEEIEDDGDDE